MPEVEEEIVPYVCRRCRKSYAGFRAKCERCGTWNMIVPLAQAADLPMPASALAGLGAVKLLRTGIVAWDKAMGGIFPGGIYLIGAEPGCGKSSLCLQILGGWEHSDTLYISTEEQRESVAARAMRFGCPDVPILAEPELGKILEIVATRPDGTFVVIDSLQKIRVHGASMGGVTALKTSVAELKKAGERSRATLLFISHVTKDDDFAGPKTVEHDVDACAMMFLYGQARVLRCDTKNRFAQTGRAGWMRMTEEGLRDASPDLVLPPENLCGRVLTITGSGLPAEVQCVKRMSGLTIGVPDDRVHMICSLINVPKKMIMVRADGDELDRDPSADLAIALAILSCIHELPLKQRTVAWGQLTLDGRLLPGFAHDQRRDAANDLELEPILSPDVHKTLSDVMRSLDLEALPEPSDDDESPGDGS